MKSRRRIAFLKAWDRASRIHDYSRDLRLAKWGLGYQFAQQQFEAADVRNGSLADMAGGKIRVRFASDSGHQDGRDRCPLSAI
jgi:hypothetical protein